MENEYSDEHSEEYSVYQFFSDKAGPMAGLSEMVRERVSPEEAVRAANHYTNSVAVKLGMITEVRIVDNDDNCVFRWEAGKGITHI
jgi:hypothetical protein